MSRHKIVNFDGRTLLPPNIRIPLQLIYFVNLTGNKIKMSSLLVKTSIEINQGVMRYKKVAFVIIFIKGDTNSLYFVVILFQANKILNG